MTGLTASLLSSFGHAVRQNRESRDWSQERLASAAGLNRTYLGELERGRALPSLATASKLAEAFDMPLTLLLEQCGQLPLKGGPPLP